MYFPRKRRRTSLIHVFSNLNFNLCVASSCVEKARHLSHRNLSTLSVFGSWEGWERYGGKGVNDPFQGTGLTTVAIASAIRSFVILVTCRECLGAQKMMYPSWLLKLQDGEGETERKVLRKAQGCDVRKGLKGLCLFRKIHHNRLIGGSSKHNRPF
jgi:hypothetical protein